MMSKIPYIAKAYGAMTTLEFNSGLYDFISGSVQKGTTIYRHYKQNNKVTNFHYLSLGERQIY